jgi:hypothetical protein
MELVYKLKGLDYLFDKIKPSFFSGPIPSTVNRYFVGEVRDFFDAEFFDIQGHRWSSCAYLRKTDGNVGDIHSDVIKDTSLCHAINIIWSGYTFMEFWDINKPENKPTSIVNGQRSIRVYSHITWPADYSYHMDRGIYLVNASGPHRATCQGDRHLFSIRSPGNFHLKWEQVLDDFKDLLVPSAGLEPAKF